MLNGLIALLACQLAGETAARTLGLPLPGPVLGLVLLLVGMSASSRLAAAVRPVAQGILGHLSLLFVPAGVGVTGHLAALGAQAAPLFLALAISTALSITVGALVFAGVARLSGAQDD
jgi:holin-like protein